MANDEIVERIQARRAGEVTRGKVGKHKVLIDTIDLPGGTVTAVHRVRKGKLTQLLAANGSYREDVAEALLDLASDAPERVHAVPLVVPGFPLDLAVVLPTDHDDTVQVAPVHHSEVLDGEKPKDFRFAASSKGTGMRLNDWGRAPVPRAEARLVDDWPGGPIRKSKRLSSWSAERLLARPYAAEVPAGVHVEIKDVRGWTLLLTREWDRIRGTLTSPDGGEPLAVDLPRHELWSNLGPLFKGEDPAGLMLESLGQPEPGLLEMRYETADRGHTQLASLQTLADCVTRIEKHILRTPGNWAVFTSRSDAVVQVACADDGRLWLETPMPEHNQSVGRHVSVQEAGRMLEILAAEDRSAVEELENLEYEKW